MAIRVTVWNEYLHEKQAAEVAAVYPKGIHGCIADFLKDAGMVRYLRHGKIIFYSLSNDIVNDVLLKGVEFLGY